MSILSKRPPRIAVVAHKMYPIDSVRERRQVEALIGAGYQVDLICLYQAGQRFHETQDKLRIFRMPVGHQRTGKLRYFLEYAAFFVFALIILSSLQLFQRYRLVQVHNIPDFLVFTAILPKLQGARVLLDIRDPMPETFQYKYGLSADSRWIKLLCWIERVSMKFADYVLAVHEPLKQIHIKRGCPPDRISVIMNLPDERFFQNGNSATWPHSSPPNFVIIYVGTLGKVHGLQTALRGLALLHKDMPGVRLRIIGGGDYLNELKQMAIDLGISTYVSFESPMPLDSIPEQLRQADVGIALQEGSFGELAFPTKVGDYMAVGLPAIVSSTTITREYFTEDMIAFIPPGDEAALTVQVRRLYNDHAYGRRLIDNSRHFIQIKNWTQEGARYLEVVARLVSLQSYH